MKATPALRRQQQLGRLGYTAYILAAAVVVVAVLLDK